MRIVWAIIYFLPVFVAFSRRNDEGADSPWRVLVVDLFLGWTILGWLYAWSLALRGYTPSTSTMWNPQAGDGPTFSAGPAQPVWGSAEPAAPRKCRCTTCGGTGQQQCKMCNGRGTWYEPPQTASGTAVLAGCDYCTRSGRIRCQTCHGRGEVPC
jgi:hypothetical protein